MLRVPVQPAAPTSEVPLLPLVPQSHPTSPSAFPASAKLMGNVSQESRHQKT